MVKRLFWLIILAGLIWGLVSCAGNTLKEWSLKDGDRVIVRAGAIACRTIDPSGEWHDCRKVEGGWAIVESHPDFGHSLAGRVRIESPFWGIGWLELADISP